MKTSHISLWKSFWKISDVVIDGDKEAQLALRYSLYHLNIIAPKHTDECGIPARGLSGQVYKGAAFWDTEMFMLPFFQFTDKNVARNLLKYRVNTLEGAKRKAREFGFEGAFFAWESQETGDDACTLFNVTDIFTNCFALKKTGYYPTINPDYIGVTYLPKWDENSEQPASGIYRG